MRIGLIAPPWIPVPPVGYGGAEAVVDVLARGLVEAGHEVRLWTTGDATCPVPRGHIVERSCPERIGDDGDERRHVAAAYDAMEAWDVDLVHDHTVAGPTEAARRSRLVVAATAHVPLDGDRAAAYRAAADGVALIAVSRAQAAESELPIAAVISHAVDLDRYRPGPGAGDARGSYLAYVGRMVPEKGPHRAAMVARRAGHRLRMAAKMASRAERAFYHREVRPLLDDRVEYVGEGDADEIAALLAGATALVNPIRWAEPFGLVMAEALACGTPVIAFTDGAAPEIVDHGTTGLLCDSVAEMAEAIHRADAIDRAACREAAVARFAPARMVAEHIAFYEELLAAS